MEIVTSNLINDVRGIESYTSEKPAGFGDWRREAWFIFSMQRPDIFTVMEGQARPTEKMDQAEQTSQLLTPGVLYTPGGTLR